MSHDSVIRSRVCLLRGTYLDYLNGSDPILQKGCDIDVSYIILSVHLGNSSQKSRNYVNQNLPLDSTA